MKRLEIGLVTLLTWVALISLASCQPKMDLFAPEKEVYVVLGILNPADSFQYLKVAQLFQFDGDAYAYAAENDLSLKGLSVEMKGNDKTYAGDEVVVQREPGVFYPEHSLYRFATFGKDSLISGATYSIQIRHPDDPDLNIRAKTTIPYAPALTSFNGPILLIDGDYTFPMVDLRDELDVFFRTRGGHGFEVRVEMEYLENSQRKTARFGPTKVFSKPVGCNPNGIASEEMCYLIQREQVLARFYRLLRESTGPLSYVDSPQVSTQPQALNRSLRVEVTALDTFLTTYFGTNDYFGFGLNLLLDKQEFSNISGEHIGIFGSIHAAHNYVYMNSCNKYLLNLYDPEFPPADCNWEQLPE